MPDFHMYIDESYDDKAPFICLAGVIVPNDKWKALNDGINNLKLTHFKQSNFNLKELRRSKYDSINQSKKLSNRKKTKFGQDYFSILSKSHVKLIVALIDKSKMERKDLISLFDQAYSFLVERLEYFLSSDRDGYGSIIMDEARNSPEVANLRKSHRNILKEGVIVNHKAVGASIEPYKKKNPFHKLTEDGSGFVHREIERVIENLHYQADQDNNFIQIADLVAYAFAIKYNRQNNKFYTKYKKFLRKGPMGRIEGYGLKIFP